MDNEDRQKIAILATEKLTGFTAERVHEQVKTLDQGFRPLPGTIAHIIATAYQAAMLALEIAAEAESANRAHRSANAKEFRG